MHLMPSQNQVLTEIFLPVPFTPDVSQWAINEIGLPNTIPCLSSSWELEWRPQDIFDRLTIWTPLPEAAPQLIYALLLGFVERPLTMAMIVVLPRVLQR